MKGEEMFGDKNRRDLGKIAAGAVAAGMIGPVHAQSDKRLDVEFYYPIAVGGQITKVVETMAEAFNRSQEKFNVKPIYTGSYDETQVKALTALKAGKGPAFVVLGATELWTLLDEDVIVSIEDVAAKTGKTAEVSKWLKEFFPGFMQNSQAGGKTYGIPFQRSTLAVFYNKDAFKEAGLDPEVPPQNWDQTREFARKLVKRDSAGNVQRWGMQIPSSLPHPFWLFQTLAASNEAIIVNDIGTKVNFAQPGAVEALDFWVQLIKDQSHPPGIVEWGTSVKDFTDGRVAILYTTSGNIANVRDNAKFPFGIAMAPMRKVRAATIGGANLFILKNADPRFQEAALAFLQFASSPEQAAIWSIATGYIATSPEAWKTPLMMDYVKKYPYVSAPRDQLAFGVREIATYEKQRINRILNDAIQSALLGKMSSKDALAQAQSLAEGVLKPYQK